MKKTNAPTKSALALQGLVKVCSDGVEGYRCAAAVARDPDLRTLLARLEVEREEIASVVTCAGIELGIKSDHGGSLAGAAHRRFLTAAGVLHADAAIAHECARGDTATLAAFAEALSHPLPEEIRGRVHAQVARVSSAIERLAAQATAGEAAAQ